MILTWQHHNDQRYHGCSDRQGSTGGAGLAAEDAGIADDRPREGFRPLERSVGTKAFPETRGADLGKPDPHGAPAAGSDESDWYRGEKANSFSVKPGETFVIGETVWTIEVGGEGSMSTGDSREILHAFTISPENLRQVPFRDAPHRLDVLGHLAKVIESAPNETELLEQAVNLLLDGIRKADVTCIIELDESAPESGVRVLSSVHRTVAGPFQPSSRLAKKAILFEQQSVVHVWTSKQDETGQMFTLMGNFDWSFCTPLHGPGGKGLAIYVAGRLQGASPASALAPWSSNDLTEDVKFAELVAAIVSALRQSSYLQHRQGILGHFFSPSVLRIVSASDPETALKPRDAEVTVLFCDLRGFSKKVELEAEHLNEILERVSMALGVMTKSIHDHGGVVADFLGDCAMAFWGWPLSHDDDVQQACKAALDIQSEFQRFSSDPLIRSPDSSRGWPSHGACRGRPDREQGPGEGYGVWSGREPGFASRGIDEDPAGADPHR